MIIPMVCFTCGKPIAHLWITYQELLITHAADESPAFTALQKLAIHRECCRRMFLCQHDMYTQVK